jgi:hypothetical protein
MIAALLALAAAAAQPGLPPDAAEASAALAQCALAEAQNRAAGSEPAEAVADAALTACAEPIWRVFDAFGRTLGPLSDADKSTLTGPLRLQLAWIVNQRRGLVPPQRNEATAAGDCIRSRAPAAAARPGPDETLVDLLLQQCRAETDAIRTRLVRERGEASADRIMPGVLESVRTLARRELAQARAAR